MDKGDQMRVHGGGFSDHVHFKKRYKKVYLATLDCGLLNARIAWNMSADNRSFQRRKLERCEFYTYVAQLMCNFQDDDAADDAKPTAIDVTAEEQRSHVPIHDKNNPRCTVCHLEYGWLSDAKLAHASEFGSRLKTNVGRCATCGVTAHTTVQVHSTRKVHTTISKFKGISCFQIMHTKLGKEIWQSGNGRKSTNVAKGHKVIRKMRQKYGLPTLGIRKKVDTGEEDDNYDEDNANEGDDNDSEEEQNEEV